MCRLVTSMTTTTTPSSKTTLKKKKKKKTLPMKKTIAKKKKDEKKKKKPRVYVRKKKTTPSTPKVKLTKVTTKKSDEEMLRVRAMSVESLVALVQRRRRSKTTTRKRWTGEGNERYMKKTTEELKAMLTARGLVACGLRDELLERLTDYDAIHGRATLQQTTMMMDVEEQNGVGGSDVHAADGTGAAVKTEAKQSKPKKSSSKSVFPYGTAELIDWWLMKH